MSKNAMEGNPMTCLLHYLCTLGLTLSAITAPVATACDQKSPDQEILTLLMGHEFKEDRTAIIAKGTDALPTLEHILSSPDQYDLLQVQRSIGVLPAIEGDKAAFIPLIERQMFAGEADTRRTAVITMRSIGGHDHAPLFVAMLYDTDATVRYQAIVSLGEIGRSPVIAALQLWKKQAASADQSRPLQDKWLDPAMTELVAKAIAEIEKRSEVIE